MDVVMVTSEQVAAVASLVTAAAVFLTAWGTVRRLTRASDVLAEEIASLREELGIEDPLPKEKE